MRRVCSWFRKRITVDCLAAAVFLVVAFGLWRGMQPRPDATISVPVTAWSGGLLRYVFSQDGSMVAAHATHSESGGRTDRLHVFETSTGMELYGTETYIRQVEWTSDHKLLLSRSDMLEGQPGWVGSITVLDPRTRTMANCFDYPLLAWARFLIAPDGKTLAICGGGDNFEGFWLIDLASRKVIASTLLGPKDQAELFGFSPDSRLLLVRLLSPTGGQLRLYDVSQGKITWQTTSFSSLPIRHAFAPDGRILALCRMQDVDVYLWDTDTGKPLHTIHVGQAIVQRGETEHDKVLDMLFFVKGGALLGVITSNGHESRRGARASQPPHRELLWPSSANFNLFDVRTGRLEHRQLLTCNPTFNRTGTMVGLESEIEKRWAIRIHDLQNGRDHAWTIETRTGHDDCFGFGPWGAGQEVLIYSGRYGTLNWDETQRPEVMFLDPATGKEIDRWRFSHWAYRVILSPDGKWLLVGHMAEGREIYELYSLPARRPWFQIFGWAVAAGGIVELVGLLLHWQRRMKAVIKAA